LVIFIDTGKNELWSIFWSEDLNERVFMVESLLTDFTVVEVLAHTTLVSHSIDWVNSTTVTCNTWVSYYAFLLLGLFLLVLWKWLA